jgi:release factor glutamine methyltransferase
VPHETIDGLLADAQNAGLARLDAQVLLAHVLTRPRTWLRAHGDAGVAAEQRQQYRAACQQRRCGVPVGYLTGKREFYGLTLGITPDVLDPRPDTEVLVDWALHCLRERAGGADVPVVADLGTGSGAVALAIKHQWPGARVLATDISAAALAVALSNGRALGLAVEWRAGDWLEALADERVDLLVSNPPYIAEGDPHLAALEHEPRLALVAGAQGLDALQHVIHGAAAHLQPGAWLLLEHGAGQADAVARLLRGAGFATVEHRRDLAGHVRCTGGRWPAPHRASVSMGLGATRLGQ